MLLRAWPLRRLLFCLCERLAPRLRSAPTRVSSIAVALMGLPVVHTSSDVSGNPANAVSLQSQWPVRRQPAPRCAKRPPNRLLRGRLLRLWSWICPLAKGAFHCTNVGVPVTPPHQRHFGCSHSPSFACCSTPTIFFACRCSQTHRYESAGSWQKNVPIHGAISCYFHVAANNLAACEFATATISTAELWHGYNQCQVSRRRWPNTALASAAITGFAIWPAAAAKRHTGPAVASSFHPSMALPRWPSLGCEGANRSRDWAHRAHFIGASESSRILQSRTTGVDGGSAHCSPTGVSAISARSAKRLKNAALVGASNTFCFGIID